jgi:hypothetical protein
MVLAHNATSGITAISKEFQRRCHHRLHCWSKHVYAKGAYFKHE